MALTCLLVRSRQAGKAPKASHLYSPDTIGWKLCFARAVWHKERKAAYFPSAVRAVDENGPVDQWMLFKIERRSRGMPPVVISNASPSGLARATSAAAMVPPPPGKTMRPYY